MDEKKAFLYTLSDPRDGRIRYVGKTTNPDARLIAHLYAALTNRPKWRRDGHKERWLRQLAAEGFSPSLEIVATVPYDRWQAEERALIARYRAEGHDLTNITAGGDGIDMPRTAEHNAKIGAGRKGKRLTPEAIARGAAKLRARNDAACKNGHPRTPENTKYLLIKGKPSRICLDCRQESNNRTRAERNAKARARRAAAANRPTNPPGRRPPPRSTRRDACKNGHPFAHGSYWEVHRKDGTIERVCKACRKSKPRPSQATPRPPRTHCKNGHELTPENTFTRIRDGHTHLCCRACKSASYHRNKKENK